MMGVCILLRSSESASPTSEAVGMPATMSRAINHNLLCIVPPLIPLRACSYQRSIRDFTAHRIFRLTNKMPVSAWSHGFALPLRPVAWNARSHLPDTFLAGRRGIALQSCLQHTVRSKQEAT